MRICFPIEKDEGLESRVFGHFGSAPAFIVVDTDARSVSTLANSDRQHVHGACNPIRALGHQSVDAVIVGGIGQGALSRLNEMGVAVLRASAATIRENLEMHAGGGLQVLSARDVCGGHGPGGGCTHG